MSVLMIPSLARQVRFQTGEATLHRLRIGQSQARRRSTNLRPQEGLGTCKERFAEAVGAVVKDRHHVDLDPCAALGESSARVVGELREAGLLDGDHLGDV